MTGGDEINMKTLRVVAVCLACAYLAHAQDKAAARPPHGLLILGLKWSRETAPTRAPPFYTPGADEVSAKPQDTGGGTVRPPTPVAGRVTRPHDGPRYYYLYTLKVKNAGPKAIQAVFWEYVTADPSDGAELGRRKLINHQKIKPGAAATLVAKSASPPTNLVTAQGPGAGEPPPRERAEIKCVLYADGTAWQPPEARGAECEELRNENKRGETHVRGHH